MCSGCLSLGVVVYRRELASADLVVRERESCSGERFLRKLIRASAAGVGDAGTIGTVRFGEMLCYRRSCVCVLVCIYTYERLTELSVSILNNWMGLRITRAFASLRSSNFESVKLRAKLLTVFRADENGFAYI